MTSPFRARPRVPEVTPERCFKSTLPEPGFRRTRGRRRARDEPRASLSSADTSRSPASPSKLMTKVPVSSIASAARSRGSWDRRVVWEAIISSFS